VNTLRRIYLTILALNAESIKFQSKFKVSHEVLMNLCCFLLNEFYI